MTKLSWDSRSYENGLDRGVLYLNGNPGIAWNGLMSISMKTDGYGSTPNYIDGYKYTLHQVRGDFAATLEAYTYPDEFAEYDGYADDVLTSQKRQTFDFSYRTKVGENHYKIHLVYGAVTQPSERANATMGGDMAPATFSWDLVADAHYEIDTSEAYPETLQAIEDTLYGSDALQSSLPDIEDIIDLFESGVTLRITDNGDGTWTAEGPDDVVTWLDDTTFQINAPTIVYLTRDSAKYRVQSY